MTKKPLIFLRLAFYITYLLNIRYHFLAGYLLSVINIVVFILIIFDLIETYKELKLEKSK